MNVQYVSLVCYMQDNDGARRGLLPLLQLPQDHPHHCLKFTGCESEAAEGTRADR